MKKTLRFSFLSIMMMLCGVASAQIATLDIDNNYATLFPTLAGTSSNESHDGDFTEATTSAAVSGVTITVSAKTSGTNDNRIWSSAPRLRLYSGTLTIKSSQTFKKVVFSNFATNSGLIANNNTVSTGTLSKVTKNKGENVTWTGEAKEIVITIAGNTQIGKIEVFAENEGGDDPDPQVFTGPTVANIAAFKQLDVDTEAKLTLNDAQVIYVNGNDAFVRDASGAIDFYGTGLTLTAGQKLNGFIIGKYELFRNLPELTKSAFTKADDFTATAGTVAPKNIGLDEVAGLVCDLVLVEGVTITKDEDGNYFASNADGDKVQVFDKFRISYESKIEEGASYDITAIVVVHNETVELCPIEDFTAGSVDPYTFVGDGSKENPYTVEDLKHMDIPENTNAAEGQEMAWVKGYIVGSLNTSGNTILEGENITAANIGLGATASETNGAACVPVQLPSGSLRTALNVLDNPAHVGKEVLVYGYILKYMNRTGVKNTADFILDGNQFTTGIESLELQPVTDGVRYNLAGQRVGNVYKGIVIQNGKKYFVR